MGDRVSLHPIQWGNMEGSKSIYLIATRQKDTLRRNANKLPLLVSRTLNLSSAVASSF